jgi:hypothetical protein
MNAVRILREAGRIPRLVEEHVEFIARDLLGMYMEHFYQAFWLFSAVSFGFCWWTFWKLAQRVSRRRMALPAYVVLVAGLATVAVILVSPPFAL